MLKRRLYWLTLGLILSQVSIAQFINEAANPRKFGQKHCAECARPVQLELPASASSKLAFNRNLLAQITGFTHGPGYEMAGVKRPVPQPAPVSALTQPIPAALSAASFPGIPGGPAMAMLTNSAVAAYAQSMNSALAPPHAVPVAPQRPYFSPMPGFAPGVMFSGY